MIIIGGADLTRNGYTVEVGDALHGVFKSVIVTETDVERLLTPEGQDWFQQTVLPRIHK